MDMSKSYISAMSAGEIACCNGAAHFLQSAFWARFKARFGWTAHAFVPVFSGGGEAPFMVLRRPLARALSLAYIPWGPVFPDSAGVPPDCARNSGVSPDCGSLGAMVTEVAAALRPLLPRDVAFLRVEPPWFTEGSVPPVLPAPWKKAAQGIQAPDTVLVDLRGSPDEMLARMKSKWRYNVRLGGRKVHVRLALQAGIAMTGGASHGDAGAAGISGGGEAPLVAFYALLQETAKRDRIAVHSFDYYAALFDEAAACRGDAVDVRLYLAEYEGRPLAGIVTLFRGREAVYLYGASSAEHRECMAPYALQWQAMQDAKAAGAAWYDLFGIPPDDNPAHPMAGLYRFKTGFGGTIVHRAGAWDYAYKPALCRAFNAAQALRACLRRLR